MTVKNSSDPVEQRESDIGSEARGASPMLIYIICVKSAVSPFYLLR
jgi:hypothetical protein